MSTPAILFIEYPADSYMSIRLPSNWSLFAATRYFGMAESMRWVFNNFPDEPWYGWLADDLRPRTRGWDIALIETAGRWGLADCHDDWLLVNGTPPEGSLTGAFVWGGDLVRTVGWWALPGVEQAGVDDAWVALTRRTPGLRKTRLDIMVEHLNHRTQKREEDDTDKWVRDGVEYIRRDFGVFQEWRDGPESGKVVQRLTEALKQNGILK